MRVLAIANQKGGTGKTATAHALGVCLADAGRRVLMVDADPQASLTLACGLEGAAGKSLAEVIGGAGPGTLELARILRELGAGLYLAPSDIALAQSELGLISRMGRENALKRVLAPVGGFDVCLIDCPPSLGLLTVNALTAAQAVLVPTGAGIQDLRGLRLFLSTLEQVREALNPDLQTLGIVVTFYDARLTHHREALTVLQGSGLPLLPVTIGRSVRVQEAAAGGQSVVSYAPENPQAAAYRELAKVVDAWLQRSARR